MSRPTDIELLALAEAVAEGRQPLADAERGLRDADRAELRSLRSTCRVRGHAEAMRANAAPSPMTPDVASEPVGRGRVRSRSNRPALSALLVGVAVLLGVVAYSFGRTVPIGTAATPSPFASPIAAEDVPPIVSTPLPGPNLAFWTVTGGSLRTLIWDPATNGMVETAGVSTWDWDTVERTVLFAPNGAHFAVHEVDVATSSPVQRLRVFDFDGTLAWEAPADPRLPIVTEMAWSPDGTALAIGSLPVPWTIVQLSETGSEPDVTTYELDDRDGYALLGFAEDANTLYGYGTGGEAEYWQKLVAVNRATGQLSDIDSIPPGPSALSWANSTAPVDRFHPDGTIITQPGGARGDPSWALRVDGNGDVTIPVDPEVVITWGLDRQLAGLGAPANLRLDLIDPMTGEAAAKPQYEFPPGDYRADLLGARDGYALVTLLPLPSPVAKEAVVLELATGRAAVGLPPASLRDGELRFGGWLGRRD